MKENVRLSKVELERIFGSSPNYKDLYFPKEKMDSLDSPERLDFVRQELKTEGKVDSIQLTMYNLDKVLNSLSKKNSRKDFVERPKDYQDHELRQDMIRKTDMDSHKKLFEQEVQRQRENVRVDLFDANELSQKYHVKGYGDDKVLVMEEPKALTNDTKELGLKARQQIREDLDFGNALEFKRMTAIEGKRVAERYRCEGAPPVLTEDFIEDPKKTAVDIRKMEEILVRMEQYIKEFPDDIHLKDALSRTRLFFVPEIKRLKKLLGKFDFSTVKKEDVKETADILMKCRNINDMTYDELLSELDKRVDLINKKTDKDKEAEDDDEDDDEVVEDTEEEDEDEVVEDTEEEEEEDDEKVNVRHDTTIESCNTKRCSKITNAQKKLIENLYGKGDFLEVDDSLYYKVSNDNTTYRVDFKT